MIPLADTLLRWLGASAPFLIVAGLVLNAVGALILGIPGLPTGIQWRFWGLTPYVRKIRAAIEEVVLLENGDAGYNPEDVADALVLLSDLKLLENPEAPVVKQSGSFEIKESKEIGHKYEIRYESADGKQIETLTQLAAYGRQFIRSMYKTGGWVLIALGFLLQIIGNAVLLLLN